MIIYKNRENRKNLEKEKKNKSLNWIILSNYIKQKIQVLLVFVLKICIKIVLKNKKKKNKYF